MIKSQINKATAKAILKAKLRFVIPIIIIVPIFAILYEVNGKSYDPLVMFGIVYPASVIIGFGAAYLGATLGANSKIGIEYQLTETELIKAEKDFSTNINLADITSVKEDRFSMRVKTDANTIWIPKQIDNYPDFQSKLIALNCK